MKDVFIVAAHRTPQGSFGGVLASQSAVELGTQIVKATVEKSGVPVEAIDEIFMGLVVQANAGQAPARQVAIQAGLGQHVPATTVNKVCASGLKAAMFGAQSIQLDQNQVVVAGGMESMTNVPHYLPKARYGYGYGNGVLVDGLQRDGLIDVYQTQPMGCFADATATKYEISREEQDAFSFASHQKALAAQKAGLFTDQIVPVKVSENYFDAKSGTKKTREWVVSQDEGPRADTTLEALGKLKPVFAMGGSVTAGNSSQMSDGAAFVLVMSEEMVKELNLEPIARLVNFASAGVEPRIMGIGPVKAIPKALKQAGLTLNDIDLIELNEAFASQSLAVVRELDLNPEIVNVNGGAIALGHPLGCTGAKLSVQLFDEMKRRGSKYGIVSMCVGTGQGSAGIYEIL